MLTQGGDLRRSGTQDFFHLAKDMQLSFSLVVIQNELSLSQIDFDFNPCPKKISEFQNNLI